jgi:hypothetical protein
LDLYSDVLGPYTSNCKQLRESHLVTHSKDHRNYNTHKVFSFFTSRCLVAASNGGRSVSSGFPNYPRLHLPASLFSQLRLSTDSTDSAISHQPPPLLIAVSRLSRNGSWSSLYSLAEDLAENASSVIACSLVAGKQRVHRVVP